MEDRAHEHADLGPVQVLAVAFDDVGRLDGSVLEELRRLRELDVVRLLDLLVVACGHDGELAVVERSGVGADEQPSGNMVAALIGAEVGGRDDAEHAPPRDSDDVWYLGDTIPPGKAAAIALLEHRWARGLHERIVANGGTIVTDEWLHPTDVAAAAQRAAEAPA
jgi:hypothetical protein